MPLRSVSPTAQMLRTARNFDCIFPLSKNKAQRLQWNCSSEVGHNICLCSVQIYDNKAGTGNAFKLCLNLVFQLKISGSWGFPVGTRFNWTRPSESCQCRGWMGRDLSHRHFTLWVLLKLAAKPGAAWPCVEWNFHLALLRCDSALFW